MVELIDLNDEINNVSWQAMKALSNVQEVSSYLKEEIEYAGNFRDAAYSSLQFFKMNNAMHVEDIDGKRFQYAWVGPPKKAKKWVKLK